MILAVGRGGHGRSDHGRGGHGRGGHGRGGQGAMTSVLRRGTMRTQPNEQMRGEAGAIKTKT